jgi:hypothetical protein
MEKQLKRKSKAKVLEVSLFEEKIYIFPRSVALICRVQHMGE